MTNLSSNFRGFPHLDSNFIWCPNQFLDRCVVEQDRGVVRLVGYVLYQTLRLLDRDGIPVEQNISVSFKAIIEEAGVSRGAASKSIAQALENRFIHCVTPPAAKSLGQKGQVGQYALRWHPKVTEIDQPFSGFYSGEGRRTQIPHAFFTDVLPFEALATVRIIAAVIRHTIGYSNQFGGRRSDAPLSYVKLQQYTGLSRAALAKAIKVAVIKGYIVVIEQGLFSTNPHQSRPTTYALNWLSQAKSSEIGSKNEPENVGQHRSVQKVNRGQFKKLTEMSSKCLPGDRFNKLTTNKETFKEHYKQAVDDCVPQEIVEMLRREGIKDVIARRIASSVEVGEIKRQIEWLPYRQICSNKAGYLVDACLNRYAEPSSLRTTRRPAELKQFEERRDALRVIWQRQSLEDRLRWKRQALSKVTDRAVAACIEFTNPKDDYPHKLILSEMALELGLPNLNRSGAEQSSVT